ncbi:YaaL family protein [Clostridium chauvoei]|uniref:YaaL family protein n=1 Tax=Clostridium chauvoei TaxID=46867 RepID=UPI001C85920B|nr:YaaL family protein [Clostridium chauvoei]MBX7419904.1 YaaL family protein [Clostridium chauvoei]
MNKGIIADLLMQRVDYSKEDQEIIDNIEDARMEMEVARAMFDFVSDPKLIEVAIHAEDVAKMRYDYLISLAKKREIRIKID